MGLHHILSPRMRPCVLLAAAPGECRAICQGVGRSAASPTPAINPPGQDRVAVEIGTGIWLVRTGVGKTSAAIATGWALEALHPASMISIGVAGTLPAVPPRTAPLPMHAVVLATECVYADEGIQTPSGYTDIAQAGFAPSGLTGMSVATSPTLRGELAAMLASDPGPGRPMIENGGAVATVSTCSGTDELARAIASRTGAIAEAMEGAAIGQAIACLRPDVHFAELRVISNTTGRRDAQVWDLPGAFAVLAQIAGTLVR